MEQKTKVQIPIEFKELFNPEWRNLVFYGGRGSGKSENVARALLLRGRQKHLRILCTREIQNTIKDSVHRLLKDLIELYEFGDYQIYNDTIVNKHTSTEFLFKGLRQNINEIKSTQGIDICWVEEAQSVSESSLDVLTPTIRKKGSQIIFTFNRFNELDPVFVKYVQQERAKTFAKQVNFDVLEKLGLLPDSLKIEMQEDKDNPALFAHKWLGEPISQSDFSILSRRAILEAMQRDILPEGKDVIGVDVARMGADRTVFWRRKGLKSIGHEIYSQRRTTEVCDLLEKFADFDNKIEIRVDDTGVGCITADTSVLTPNGWKYPSQLSPDDQIYSKNEDGNVTTTSLFSISKRSAEIIEADGYKFAWAHQIRFKTRNNYDYQIGTWEKATDYKQAIFDTVFNYEADEYDFTMPKQSIIMPNSGVKTINPELHIDAHEFAILLGWYVSEGSLDRSSRCVTITQKKTQHFDEIQRVLSYFGRVQVKRNGNSGGKDFKVFNKSLYDWLGEYCYNGGTGFKYKTVPRWIANNSVSVIKEFMRAFKDGDGYVHANGRNYYITSSVNLVDDFMELIYKVGKTGSHYKKYDKGSTFKIEGRTATRTEDNYVIFEYAKNGYGIAKKETKKYEGDVYSLVLNNDTRLMFTKVDGKKPFWTHNGGVTDELLKRGYSVIPVNFGGEPADKNKYPNWISEAWFNIGNILAEAQLIHIPELLMELSTRQWKQDIRGRREVESKNKYKKRGYRSPDIADAVIICYAEPRTITLDDIAM